MAVSRDRALTQERRTQIADALRQAPQGLGVQTLAERLELHPNTVRWHLGVLASSGAVQTTRATPSTRGRPRILYRLTDAAADGTRDEYRLLATMLSGTVAELPDGAAAAEHSGRLWGRYLIERKLPLVHVSEEDAVERVSCLLAEQGFVSKTAPGEIRMRRCPYHDLAEAQPEVVCAAHRGLIDGALHELGSELAVRELEVLAEGEICIARLARR